MKFTLIAVGKNMPAWVETGYQEYVKRLPSEFTLNLIEISAPARTKNSNIKQLQEKEGRDILAALTPRQKLIVLDCQGKTFNTLQLARQLQTWRENAEDLAFVIGGPDGLSFEVLTRADLKWSLSPLTLPHPLVRIVLAEQLYRTWSILAKHPYHR